MTVLSVDSPWRRFRVIFFFLEIGFAVELSLYPAPSTTRRLSKAIAPTGFPTLSAISIRLKVETI